MAARARERKTEWQEIEGLPERFAYPMSTSDTAPPEWRMDREPVDYLEAVATMESRVMDIRNGNAPELVWLLEHPPLYTAGTSANPEHLLSPDRFPVHKTGRGGEYTYHGPGQRVAYVMLDLKRRGPDIRCYVHNLEEWVIRSLDSFGIKGERRKGRVGIWVAQQTAEGIPWEAKIAAVGVRVRRWVTYHGIAINVAPDLSHFEGIVPCGILEHGVTSFADLGLDTALTDLDFVLQAHFEEIFS